MYKELIEKIERFNMVFCYAQCISAFFNFTIPLLHSYVRYYVYDMEEESFYLYLPAWFVFSKLDVFFLHSFKRFLATFMVNTQMPEIWRKISSFESIYQETKCIRLVIEVKLN